MPAAVPDGELELDAVGEGLGLHGDRDEAGGEVSRMGHVSGNEAQLAMAFSNSMLCVASCSGVCSMLNTMLR